MKEDVSERLSVIMKMLHMNMNQLSNALNFKNSVVGNVINQRNLPSFDFIYRLKSFEKKIDLNWFFTGDGSIFQVDSTENSEVYKELATTLKRENELLREKIAQYEQSIDSKNKKIS